MQYNTNGLSKKQLIHLYEKILTPRLIEEKMLILLRQGKISKWFSGIGQEAISVAAAEILEEDEYILPMHRNLGVFTGRNIPLHRLFSQFQGKLSGYTKGRDRSFHFGSAEDHIVGMISHLGPQLSVADGIALGTLLDKKEKVTLVFSGDGGTSQGEFHEAVNVAAVWQLPVIFLIENNGYGLSTPSNEQFRFKSFTDKGPGYGIDTISLDGNNLLEMYSELKKIAEDLRKNPRPILVEAMTFRMRGHEEASGTKYVPKKLMDHWAKKDPVINYEKFLLAEKILSKTTAEEIKNKIKKAIDEGLEKAYAEDIPEADTFAELNDVYFPFEQKIIEPKTANKSKKRFVDAISDGLSQSLERFDELVIMGQDIAEYGGVFKVTEGFLEKFGKDRIRNTPLCESAILGMGLGLSIQKKKSVIEMQFADFVTCGFNQIVNNLAKAYYRWGQNADTVVRLPTGAGVGAGPYHSQSNEAWFFHTPGLKIVYPSNPYDAKGLLTAAIEDPNPVLYFEHKLLYRSLSEDIPDDYYTLEIGKGKVIQPGNEVTVITYGTGVHWVLETSENFPQDTIEIIDLRTLLPWDKELVFSSVKRTGKAMILHEDTLTGGIGAEIAAAINEECFSKLDAPVVRVGSLDTPIPFSSKLEQNFLAKSRLNDKIRDLIEF